MTTVEIIDKQYDKKRYNLVAEHPLQTWQWGEARERMGVETLRIGEFKSHQLISVYQMTIHELRPFPLRIGYIPRSLYPSVNVLQFLLDYGKKNNLIFIKLEPYVHADSKFQISRPLTKSSHPLFPSWTQILDISPPHDELLMKMKQKTRYNIRLAQKKGVIIKEMSNDEGFEIFQNLYFDTCKRQKYLGHNKKYHEIVWDSMKDGLAHILVAYHQDKPLAVYELFHFKDTFYYPYGGTSTLCRNLMAANLLMWEAILLGKKLGAKQFDLWGSLPPNYNPDHPWAGFTRFKEGYGAKYVEMMEGFDLVINPFLYSLYNVSYQLRQMFLKLIK